MESESIFCVTADVILPEISRGTKHGKVLKLAVQVESLGSAMLKANQKSQVREFSQVREYKQKSFNLLSTYYVLAQCWCGV